MRALVLLLTLHGLRISEALERTPKNLDTEHWTLTIPDTKTGEPALARMEKLLARRWLFGTKNRSNIYRDIKKACKLAGVQAFGSHALGRHSFATRVLRDGKSLAHLKDAGRWKTIKMPAMRYGHLEKSEVSDSVNDLADHWSEKLSEEKVTKLKRG